MIDEVLALTMREVKKWIREPLLIFIMLIQPTLWLGFFGKAFNLTGLVSIPPEIIQELPPDKTRIIAELFNRALQNTFGGTTDYFTYLAAGMLSVVVLFTSMFSGMSIVWDRRLGFLNKLLVAPISRSSIVMAKVCFSVLRGVIQALLVFSIALAFGLKLSSRFDLIDLLGIIVTLILLSIGLSSLFIAITVRIRSWEAHAAVVNLLNLPLMFASSALFPIKQMPDWLQMIARYNPVSYSSDNIRIFILHGDEFNMSMVISNFNFLIVFALVSSIVGIFVAERMLRSG
ncbi:MAG: ABC transporter permease [Nitrososphaerota archaeon]|nr:ABC transporter permease [Nitrososphaerales archaeon]MDW8044469.1 ABC transporter permease [Nitrososphaerota archaeon]